MIEVSRDVEQPPGGWSFLVDETGVTLTGPSALSVMQKVKKHMRANDIPLPDNFKAWLENELCLQMQIGYPFCCQAVPEKPRNPIHQIGRASCRERV